MDVEAFQYSPKEDKSQAFQFTPQGNLKAQDMGNLVFARGVPYFPIIAENPDGQRITFFTPDMSDVNACVTMCNNTNAEMIKHGWDKNPEAIKAARQHNYDQCIKILTNH